jgi:hypothetical protein
VPAKSYLPPGLPAELARPLVAASARVAELKPWEFMSDLHLVGVRDATTGELHVASVMGALRQVFGVIFYRRVLGLRYIHKMATEPSGPDPEAAIEALDYLQVEWTSKRELRRTDQETLANAAYKPAGRGPVWPRFSSCEPGWFPWFPNQTEARQLADFIQRVNRFARLLKYTTTLYQNHPAGEVPLVPAGPEDSLGPEEIEWLPLVPGPVPPPEPIVLSAEDRAALQNLPVRSECIFELLARLMPEMSFFDDEAHRPVCGRIGLLSDRASFYILSSQIVHGAAPLREVAGKVLVKGLLAAKARPSAIHVDWKDLLEVLRPAGESIGVPVRLVKSLPAASDALAELGRFGGAVHDPAK